MSRFTKRQLEAIAEALVSRLSGERDNEDDPAAPTTEDYDSALDEVSRRLRAYSPNPS
jgi:hypothetical protein